MILHRPVLLSAVIQYLAPQPNQNFIDCTIGGAGQAEAILRLTGPTGKLLGLDWDAAAVQRAQERLRPFGGRVILVQASYTKIKQIIYDKKFTAFSGILLDLGLSSDQLQSSGRGFSFQVNEPLDMRYCPEENQLTAAEIVNQWPAERLIAVLKNNADEKQAGRIVRQIVNYRAKQKIDSTLALVSLIMNAVPARRARIHPATKTFQALRMEVNQERQNIQQALKDILDIAPSGARVAVITFHSVEDRLVKNYFRDEARACRCPPDIPVCQCGGRPRWKLITKKPVKPTMAEINENFRSRSAKLRVVERI